ncbi:6-carboxytetrahydropterin synthase QueD [Proteinivorax hydrogeniformans]|uniref:6-carboxy-5,6,7,8-tetrahydropterin synthase n=1 Tax=Proteinivorax hydrogeniformans TaxID=1826727 RepID=A0AAU8HRP7_9FIRM
MFILKAEVQFDLAHYLSNYEGKCSNIHGHRYRLIAKVKGEDVKKEGQLRGMVEDFGTIKKALKEIEDYFDHKLIIEDDEIGQDFIKRMKNSPQPFEILTVPYRPTAEEMSRHIYHMLKDKGFDVHEVELFETPTNSCIYTEADND